MNANRSRLGELGRLYGYQDGYEHIRDGAPYCSHPTVDRQTARRIVFVDRCERHKTYRWLPLFFTTRVHRRTIQRAYDLGFHYGQCQARKAAQPRATRPTIRILPAAARDQA